MKKNIVYILADQLRADFCGCYGADWLNTPNIDALALDGVLYTTAISPSPACVPARASLLTGRSAVENRVTNNNKWLRPDHEVMGVYTWPKLLADAGYNTASIGKMHFYPWDISEGFQKRIIAEDKRHILIMDDYSDFLQQHGYKRMHGNEAEGYYDNMGAIVNTLPDELHIDKFVCDKTCEYLEEQTVSQPFALMVGFPGPHCPYDPSQQALDNLQNSPMPQVIPKTPTSSKFLPSNIEANALPWNGVDIAKFTPEKAQKVRKHYSALVETIDNHVGTIITKLKEKGLYDKTVIIFTSDHGDFLGDYGMAGKYYFYESATRIPMIVHNSGAKSITVDHPVSLTDTYNTVLHLAGINIVDTSDNTTLAPFGLSQRREAIFGCSDIGWMLRDEQYQISIYNNGVTEFFNIVDDPQMQKNLWLDPTYHQKIVSMRMELDKRIFNALRLANVDTDAKSEKDAEAYSDKNPFNYRGWQRKFPNNGVL